MCFCFKFQEAVLKATQCIPDIVRLQRQLYDEFHHRINHKVAHSMTIGDFICTKHTGISVLNFMHNTYYILFGAETLQNEYQDMVASVQYAWTLVREKLKDHGD